MRRMPLGQPINMAAVSSGPPRRLDSRLTSLNLQVIDRKIHSAGRDWPLPAEKGKPKEKKAHAASHVLGLSMWAGRPASCRCACME